MSTPMASSGKPTSLAAKIDRLRAAACELESAGEPQLAFECRRKADMLVTRALKRLEELEAKQARAESQAQIPYALPLPVVSGPATGWGKPTSFEEAEKASFDDMKQRFAPAEAAFESGGVKLQR
jgi:hypothetical protein